MRKRWRAGHAQPPEETSPRAVSACREGSGHGPGSAQRCREQQNTRAETGVQEVPLEQGEELYCPADPERPRSLPSAQYSRTAWTHSCAVCSRMVRLEQGGWTRCPAAVPFQPDPFRDPVAGTTFPGVLRGARALPGAAAVAGRSAGCGCRWRPPSRMAACTGGSGSTRGRGWTFCGTW